MRFNILSQSRSGIHCLSNYIGAFTKAKIINNADIEQLKEKSPNGINFVSIYEDPDFTKIEEIQQNDLNIVLAR